MKISEFIKDSNGMYSSSRLFALLITLSAITDWMYIVFTSDDGVWHPKPQTIALVIGVLGFRYAQKFGEGEKPEKILKKNAVKKPEYEIKKTKLKIYEFLMETNGQFSSARLFSFLITFATIVDWMHAIFFTKERVWDPEYQTVAMVLGVLGFKFAQKFQEKEATDLLDKANKMTAKTKTAETPPPTTTVSTTETVSQESVVTPETQDIPQNNTENTEIQNEQTQLEGEKKADG